MSRLELPSQPGDDRSSYSESLQEFLAANPSCAGLPWAVSSVSPPGLAALRAGLASQNFAVNLRMLTLYDVPLKVDVESPDRVGIDRLMALLAAWRRARLGHGALVIDAGTAITVDLITAEGLFRGGAIAAGVRAHLRGLAAVTSLLPEVGLDPAAGAPDPIGGSTEKAIQSGVYWGMVGAVQGLMSAILRQSKGPTECFVTGGWGRVLEPYLKPRAIWIPDLVLEGIFEAATGPS